MNTISIRNNVLSGNIGGRLVEARLRRNPAGFSVPAGRYKVVKSGVDPALGGVMVMRPASVAAGAYEEITFLRLIGNGNNSLVVSSRSLGNCPSLILDGSTLQFFALPECGDEVIVS
jgi:hypothetical protein